MTEQEAKLRAMLGNNPAGAKAAANLDDIMRKIKTAENQKSIDKLKQNPQAAKAMEGDAQAMSALLKDLLASAEGQNFINQVKQATEE